ncbi:BOLA class I histocompatibility antigen, alpha chain BL3-7-like isoform X1, partial [Clarias magur]
MWFLGEMVDYSSELELLLFISCVVHLSSAETTTLQYLYTALTPGLHFPQFTAVGLVDGEQVVYYDSHIKKIIPQTEWMKKIEADDPRYWDGETRRMTDQQDEFQKFVYQAKQRFNPTGGDHTVQRMFGCECDDNVTTRGYDQYGYDGEDFISLNLTTRTWTAVNDEVKSFINDWDPKDDESKYWKNFLETDCIDQLKKFVSHGKKYLQRK